jgi:alpha-tubulin suppressor-like RCC1 family protein
LLPSFAVGNKHSLFLDAAGLLLVIGEGAAVGHGDENANYSDPAPVTALARVRMRSVLASRDQSLALGWDGRVNSWGDNRVGQLGHGDTQTKPRIGQLGHGDTLTKPAPALVEGLEGVRCVAASFEHSFAATLSGAVFSYGRAPLPGAEDSLRPITVEGFEGVCVRRVCAGEHTAFAVGEAGELFSWGQGKYGLLGHGDTQNQPSPKRVEALRGVRVSSVSVGWWHALVLAEDGLVYAWGHNSGRALLGNPDVEREPLPKPVEALRGVRVGSVAAAQYRSYAVADTGELWSWGFGGMGYTPLGHGEQTCCPLPKPVESLRGVKVDAVAGGFNHTLAPVGDGSVYVWGHERAATAGSFGLGPSGNDAPSTVHTPQRIPALRVACEL